MSDIKDHKKCVAGTVAVVFNSEDYGLNGYAVVLLTNAVEFCNQYPYPDNPSFGWTADVKVLKGTLFTRPSGSIYSHDYHVNINSKNWKLMTMDEYEVWKMVYD